MAKLSTKEFVQFLQEHYGIKATLKENATPYRFEDFFGWRFPETASDEQLDETATGPY